MWQIPDWDFNWKWEGPWKKMLWGVLRLSQWKSCLKIYFFVVPSSLDNIYWEFLFINCSKLAILDLAALNLIWISRFGPRQRQFGSSFEPLTSLLALLSIFTFWWNHKRFYLKTPQSISDFRGVSLSHDLLQISFPGKTFLFLLLVFTLSGKL